MAGHIEPYIWGFRLRRECIYNKTLNTVDSLRIVPNMAGHIEPYLCEFWLLKNVYTTNP